MSEAIIKISEKGFGCIGITSDDKLIGIITDGDLRRALKNKDTDEFKSLEKEIQENLKEIKKHTKLNESQKSLLREYINNVSNTSKFKEYYTQQLKEVITNLVSAHKTIKDKVTKIKLKETINVLKKAKVGRVVSDNQVTAMMIAYELIQEIKNVKES